MLILYIKRRRAGELDSSKEILILHHRFKLKKENLNAKRLGLFFTFMYSLIVALTGTIISDLDLNTLWRILFALAMLTTLIYILFAITANVLRRKERKK